MVLKIPVTGRTFVCEIPTKLICPDPLVWRTWFADPSAVGSFIVHDPAASATLSVTVPEVVPLNRTAPVVPPAVPIVTVIGIGVALLIGGVVITETVFNIPGIGRLVVDAIARRDYNAAVQDYNTEIRTFPGVIWSKLLYSDLEAKPSFSAKPGADEAPKVSFQ